MLQETGELNIVSIKILEDADIEKRRIIMDAEEKKKEILDTAGKKKGIIFEEAGISAKKRYSQVYALEISKARSSMEQKALLDKISIIDGFIAKAKERLATSDFKLFEDFLKDIIGKQGFDGAQYQIGKKEKNITDAMIQNISKAASIKRSEEPADFDEGIKLIDGRKEYFLSPESLIRDRIEDIRMEIAGFLFEKG